MSVLTRVVPEWIRHYKLSWLSVDVLAGVTLAAIAVPEVMGYTSIAQTPVITGLYTIIFPTLLFALLGSSRLLVVGADSATAAILAAGLAGLGISGLSPNSSEWVAWTSLVALVCGGMLILARLLRLGFLGDFLSASVLIGFLTGVGISVLTGQLPDMLGIPKGTGNWFEQQWSTLTHLTDASLWTVAFAAGTLLIIVGCKLISRKIPGAVIAVVLSIVLSNVLDASSHGVAVIGPVQGGMPPFGLPQGLDLGDIPAVMGVALSCFFLIIAQSAATSRSFAMKHSERVDINKDIVGLAGANIAAGLTGTFVVNGSPTKTEILDEQRGRSQMANITMSLVVIVVVLFLTRFLTNMPVAVLAAIVFMIGLGLVDLKGLRRISAARVSEFVIACVTAIVVFAWGVEEGIILAIALSVLELVRRAYTPVGLPRRGEQGRASRPTRPPSRAARVCPGCSCSASTRDCSTRTPACSSTASRNSSPQRRPRCAGSSWTARRSATSTTRRASTWKGSSRRCTPRSGSSRSPMSTRRCMQVLTKLQTLEHFDNAHIYPTVQEAVAAFRADSAATAS